MTTTSKNMTRLFPEKVISVVPGTQGRVGTATGIRIETDGREIDYVIIAKNVTDLVEIAKYDQPLTLNPSRFREVVLLPKTAVEVDDEL